MPLQNGRPGPWLQFLGYQITKSYARMVERRLQATVELQIQEGQNAESVQVCPSRETVDYLFIVLGLLEVHGSLPIRSSPVLWTWRRLVTVSPGESCWGNCRSMGHCNKLIRSFYNRMKSCVGILSRKSNS